MSDETENIIFGQYNESTLEAPLKKNKWLFVICFLSLLTLFFSLSLIFIKNYATKPPNEFPINSTFVVEKGASTWSVIQAAKQQRLIRYELALYFELKLNHPEDLIKAGTYTFSKPLDLAELATELTLGNHLSDLVKITNIEGETSVQVANKAASVLTNFNAQIFIEMAKPLEGRLFPDTYLVPKYFTEAKLVYLLTSTFEEKISAYKDRILASKLSLDDIIILASILEREANTMESKKIVSGILQKRLSINMPLQVDASLEYVLDKPLSKLTAEDLDIDSPYNTYLNYGLPPTAIGNPGLDSIIAVLEPEETNYLFYITGDDGNFYYAKDFDTHKLNVAKYLR